MPELPYDDLQGMPRVGLLRMRLLREVLEVAMCLPTAVYLLRISRLPRERARRDMRHAPGDRGCLPQRSR